MLTVFWSARKVCLIYWTPLGERMNAAMFTDEILKELNRIVKKDSKTALDPTWIHYDNARVYTAKYTTKFLEKSVFCRMP